MSDVPNTNPPNRKALLFRLLYIALVLFPVSYVTFALLVDNWFPFATDDESIRHIVEWLGLLAGGIGLVFCISQLPLQGWRGLRYLFPLFSTGAFVVFLVIGLTSGKHYPMGPLLWNCLLAATVGGLAAAALFTSIGWLCCWKNFRRFLFSLACIATLIALFYAEENWRGKHDWENYKQEWAAKGEQFDFADFYPPTVADDQNFAMAPMFDTMHKLASRKWRSEHHNPDPHSQNPWDTNLVDPTDISLGLNSNGSEWPTNGFGDWQRQLTSDLTAWQNYYRALAARTNFFAVPAQPQSPAQDVLLALSKYDPVIEDLREAAKRPESRFPLDYDDEDPAEILLPHLAAMKRCSMVVEGRALAELQAGETDKAFADTMLTLRLADAIKTEPFIITHLVRIAILKFALQPVYEGLAEHKWSDAQLAGLDAELAKINFLADYERSTRSECAAHAKVIEWMEQKPSRFWDLFNMVDDSERKVMNNFWLTTEIYLMPRGWFYQSDIAMAEVHRQWIEPMVDDANQTVSPERARQSKEAVGALKHTAMNLFARLLLPELGKYAMRTAQAQTAANEARIAIALERYRLAHGNVPDSLDVLVPQYLAKIPHDIIGGPLSPGSGAASQPLKYSRSADGSFVLYSVGWNGTDDGGVVGYQTDEVSNSYMDWESKTGPKPPIDLEKGDWVWRYPQK
jgi:hypothetical protein